MVKIGRTLKDLDLLAEDHYKVLCGKPFELPKKIRNIAQNCAGPEKALFLTIETKFRDIITARPDRLEILRKDLHRKYRAAQNANTAATKKNIKKAFNYDKFRDEDHRCYAYDLAENLGEFVCPYCNRQYIITLRTSDKKTRPQFDHFYNRVNHPYFSLSFFNLVPSCSVCNSTNMKGEYNFRYSRNLHPFIEGANDVYGFRININAADFVEGNKTSFRVMITKRKGIANEEKYERAIRNVNVFGLRQLYDKHRDDVANIIKKAYYYNSSRIQELMRDYPIFGSDIEAKEFILGNFVREEHFGRQVLSKLAADISEDLGLGR